MWEAAIGVLIGYAFGLWWVRRGTSKEVASVREMYAGRLEAREEEIKELRTSFEESRREVADLDRRSRYLESALGAEIEHPLVRPGTNGKASLASARSAG